MKITVYGLGHLGLPLAVVLARAGFDVIGVDPGAPLDNTEPNIRGPELEKLERFATPQASDVSFIVVPTPSTEEGDFDPKYVVQCLAQIDGVNEPGHLAVLVSTVSPGTCAQLTNIAGLVNTRLVYNPTFIALGNVVDGLVRPDLLLIASPALKAQSEVGSIWSQVFRTQQHRYDSKTAYHLTRKYEEVELLKLAVNAALGTKISLANSLGELFNAYGVDPEVVTVMGNDPRIGAGYLLPGSPITGPCLPRDNRALRHAAKKVDVTLPISEATEVVQNEWYKELLTNILSTRPETLGILGMVYKKGTGVTTNSVGEVLADVWPKESLKIYDETLAESDDYEDVLLCDVIVCTQRRLMPGDRAKGRVISL